MPAASRIVNKLIGPTVMVTLIGLALLLVLDVGLQFTHASSLKKAARDSELTITIVDAYGLGKEAGGSRSPDVFVIPHLGPGEYNLMLRRDSDGQTRFTIEPLTSGSAFKYLGSSDIASGSEWLLQLQVEVLDGLVKNVSAMSYGPAPSIAVSAGPVADGGGPSQSIVAAVREALSSGIAELGGYSTDRWVAICSFIFLVLVLVAIARPNQRPRA